MSDRHAAIATWNISTLLRLILFLDLKFSTEVSEFISHWMASPVLLSQQWRHRSLVSDWPASAAGEAWYHSCKRVREYATRTGGRGWCTPPPWGFSQIAKKRRHVATPGFGVPYGANLAQLLVKKQLTRSGQSRSYDVKRGTTPGNFTNKSVFYRTWTWRHWCKW